jgi:two-component system, chemotaxis family, CheB/CheR fusion protein
MNFSRANCHASPLGASSRTVFPIVGIGASAGGLDAFKKFFSALPAESGMAFVLIQHLDPTRQSLTAELVGTHTRMRVVQAVEGMRIEANRVYVIPPNAYLSVRERTLWLSAPTAPRSLRMAVDFFLRSLAEDQGENAIGIILSGTGTDGTLGLKEIKAGGGMTMVQDPQSAQHDGMPRSAIASGSADYVLPAEQMADALLAYVRHAAVASTSMAVLPEKTLDPLTAVVEVMRERTKFDFSGYKKGTLRRRIQRRMGLRHFDQLAEYVEVLRNDPAEATALFKDLLINVTSFFREPAAWQILQEQVIRRLVAEKIAADAPLRVWIPACATGEEAYSIAMVLIEEIQATGKSCRLQVFASDVDAEALETARAGIYPEGIAAHVSAERLSRFFSKDDHIYRVDKALRDTVVFAQQSLVSDPPFSRLDVISCRNLLIYLEPAVQERLIPLLHFALLKGGYLFLGSAEGVGLQEDLFEPVSTKWRIYRRIGPARHGKLQFRLAATPVSSVEPGRLPSLPNPARLATLAQHLLLQRYAPACVIIDRNGEILYFHGRTDDYLAQPSGLPTQDLIAQARHGLRSKLRSAVHEAIQDNQRVIVPGVQVRRGNTFSRVKVTVEALHATDAGTQHLWLVSLEDEPETSAPAAAHTAAEASAAGATLVQQLEFELKSTREDLQQTVEDLKAANEELMSINEEFQSSNEELETSKEELQSLNEELTTANTQLETKLAELEATNNDLDNLLTSTNIATLFLDTHLHIRRFTPAATRLFSLIPSDIGRPIGDITQQFTDPDLLSDVAAVLQRPMTPKAEVQAHDGRWYVRQVLPYRTRDHRTEGVVVTFSDVAAEALQEGRLYAESIVDTVREPLLVLDGDLRVRSANQSFYATFHVSQKETVGQLLYELGTRQWDIPELRTLLGDVLPQKQVMNDFELEPNFESIGPRSMQLNARAIDRGGGRPYLILLAIEDVTERKQTQEALQESETLKHVEEQVRQRQAELAHAQRISTVGELASGLAHELNQPLSAIANYLKGSRRLLEGASDERSAAMRDALDKAADQAMRAGQIIRRLRDFVSRGESERRVESITKLVEEASALALVGVKDRGIRVTFQFDPAADRVLADRVQIQQVLLNLIRNAMDAMEESQTRDLIVAIAADGARFVRISVTDSGSGISPEIAEQLFQPFITTKRHGMGVGLSISRAIVEAHGGRIWVEPNPAGGTIFSFTLAVVSEGDVDDAA